MIAKGEDDCQGWRGGRTTTGWALQVEPQYRSHQVYFWKAGPGESPGPEEVLGSSPLRLQQRQRSLRDQTKTNKQGNWFRVSVLPSLCIFLPLFSKASLLEMGFVKENRPGVGQKCQTSDPAPESVFLAGASGE